MGKGMPVVIVFGGVSELVVEIISGTIGEGLLFTLLLGCALTSFEFWFLDGMFGDFLD
jgi:hypothetical protein